MTTKKLLDIAKAQQNEVANMRTELDRLRLRTFPSFLSMAVPLQPGDEMF